MIYVPTVPRLRADKPTTFCTEIDGKVVGFSTGNTNLYNNESLFWIFIGRELCSSSHAQMTSSDATSYQGSLSTPGSPHPMA